MSKAHIRKRIASLTNGSGPKAQEHYRRGEGKILRSRGTGTAMKLLPRRDRDAKPIIPQIIWLTKQVLKKDTTTDMLTWKSDILPEPIPDKELQAIKDG